MQLEESIKRNILEKTGAQDIESIELVQPLWNNYGTLSRIYLSKARFKSVILKHIKIPYQSSHPKGFGGNFSRQRKVQSYHVEQYWYQHYNKAVATSSHCPTPICIDTFHNNGEIFLLLEDVHNRGFTILPYQASQEQIDAVLRWLAYFHARFMQQEPVGLWETGTYWHLATRPEEHARLKGTDLFHFASFIDARLSSTQFHTIVHGDAKLANFCFHHAENTVAAVDFQYIGKGNGMKDLAYFVGSVMNEAQCKQNEEHILDTYFSYLAQALQNSAYDIVQIETEWRALYRTAWADFQRFLLGWSPIHTKNTSYSNQITEQTVQNIEKELLTTAVQACQKAGKIIMNSRDKALRTFSKNLDSPAGDIVTEVDLAAQEIIVEELKPSIEKYNLGLLAEETHDDKSRLQKHAFWTIDPLDGTRYYAQGEDGFSISIALVNKQGTCILGVVLNPVNGILYHSIKGKGVFRNGNAIHPKSGTGSMTRCADISLKEHPEYTAQRENMDILFCGGAICNALHVIEHQKSFYAKSKRKKPGGCAIWDLAAVSLMATEIGGTATFLDGRPLHLNREETVYFHDVGIIISSGDFDCSAVIKHLGTSSTQVFPTS